MKNEAHDHRPANPHRGRSRRKTGRPAWMDQVAENAAQAERERQRRYAAESLPGYAADHMPVTGGRPPLRPDGTYDAPDHPYNAIEHLPKRPFVRQVFDLIRTYLSKGK